MENIAYCSSCEFIFCSSVKHSIVYCACAQSNVVYGKVDQCNVSIVRARTVAMYCFVAEGTGNSYIKYCLVVSPCCIDFICVPCVAC
jgi:hypothetical protein